MLNEDGAPALALLLRSPIQRERYAQAAARAGWTCVELDVENAWSTDHVPSLIVADVERVGSAARVRDARAPGTGLVAAARDVVGSADEAVPPNAQASAHDALLARWRPLPWPDAMERQIAAFGPDHLLPLLARLRARLTGIIVADAPAARAGAHQLAGLAGILGFADVCTGWEAVSRDGESAMANARRASRLAIAALDRRLPCAPQH